MSIFLHVHLQCNTILNVTNACFGHTFIFNVSVLCPIVLQNTQKTFTDKWLYAAKPLIYVSRTCWESISEISQVCQIRFFWGEIRQQVQSIVWSSGISHPNIQVSILMSHSICLVKIWGLDRNEDCSAFQCVISLFMCVGATFCLHLMYSEDAGSICFWNINDLPDWGVSCS